MTTQNIVASSVAGVVCGVDGVVTVRSSTGVARILMLGDFVFLGDTIRTGAGSSIHIDFKTGGFVTLDAGQSLHLDGSLPGAVAEASRHEAATRLVPVGSQKGTLEEENKFGRSHERPERRVNGTPTENMWESEDTNLIHSIWWVHHKKSGKSFS